MGLKAYKYSSKKKPSTLFDEFDLKSVSALNFKEIIYAAIVLNNKPGSKCTNCFEKLKIEMDEYFDYIGNYYNNNYYYKKFCRLQQRWKYKC